MCPTEAGKPAAASTQPSLDPEAPTGSPFHEEHLHPPTWAQRRAPGTDPRPLPSLPLPPPAH